MDAGIINNKSPYTDPRSRLPMIVSNPIRGRPFDFEGEELEDFFGSKYLFSFYSRLNHLFLYRPNQIIVLHFFVFSRVNQS